MSWESEAADSTLLGDTPGGERSVRSALDNEKMNRNGFEVLLAKMLAAEKTPQDMHITESSVRRFMALFLNTFSTTS